MNNPNQAPKNIIIEGNNSQNVESTSNYPSHIRKILFTLKDVCQDSAKISKILSQYSYYTFKDETLKGIYELFGWECQNKIFNKTIIYEEFLEKLRKGYEISVHDAFDKNREITKEPQEEFLFSHGFSQHFAKNDNTMAKNMIMNSYDSNFTNNNNFIDCFLTNSAKAWNNTNRGFVEESSMLSQWVSGVNNQNNGNFHQENIVAEAIGEQSHKFPDRIDYNSLFSLRNNEVKKKGNQALKLKKRKKVKQTVVKKEKRVQNPRNNSNLSNVTFDNDMANGLKSYGLKEISFWVKKIVKERKKTNYKEISDIIVEKIKASDKSKAVSSKDEKNIRRRIYDSLNVMKALSLFKNEKNKTIMWNEDFKDKDINEEAPVADKRRDLIKQNQDKQNLESINRSLEEKQKNIEKIKLEILKLDAQKRVLQDFIKRNKEENNLKQETSISADDKERIYFPFLLIEFPDNKHNSISIVSNDDKSKLHLAFKEPFEIYGDLDSIMKLQHKACEKNLKFN